MLKTLKGLNCDCLLDTSTWHIKVNISKSSLLTHLPNLLLPGSEISEREFHPSSRSAQKHWLHPQLLIFTDNQSALPLKHIQHLPTCCPGASHTSPCNSLLTGLPVSIPIPLNQCPVNFILKSQIVNILGSVGQMVSVATTQLGCYSLKAASDNTQTNEHGSVPVNWNLNGHWNLNFMQVSCATNYYYSSYLFPTILKCKKHS